MVIFRHPSAISRCSRALLSSTKRQASPVAILTGYAHRIDLPSNYRTFATKKSPKEPKDTDKPPSTSAEQKNAKTSDPASTPSDGLPGKPAPGFENLYKSSSLSNNSKNQEPPNEDTLEPGWTRLTPEEEKFLDQRQRLVSETLPKSLSSSIEQAIGDLKKHGVPPELQDIIKDFQNGKGLSLSSAARLIRVTHEIARRKAERNLEKTEEREKQEKKDSPSPSFFFQDKNSQNDQENKDKDKNKSSGQEKDDFKIGTFKMDTGQIIMTALATYVLWQVAGPRESTREITWQEFQGSLLNKGLVEKLQVVDGKSVKVYVNRDAVARAHPDSPAVNPNFFYTFTIGSVEAFEFKLEFSQDELGIPSSERIPVSYQSSDSSAMRLFMSFAPTLLSIGFIIWLFRRASGGGGGGGGPGGLFGMGKSRAKKFSHETAVQVKFKDVAGADEAKLEIMEFVSFLKDPGRFEKLGAKIPRGAILSGPPGTGKTLLAKATAGESGVPFFSCSGSEFIEIFVGVGPSRVRDLFAQARKNTPCIIFIDEIDAIGKSRAKQSFGGGNDEREATLNQILTEMDGFNTSDQVVVLAGTNRPDVLDSALMRPGRFDRHISIDRPTLEGRKQIFAVYLPKIRTSEDLDFLAGRLASLTPGFSGADIANCVNEAALIAARASADQVVIKHFEQAIERVVAGLEKKTLVLSPEEKKVVAYHEAGHAICGWFFKYADPLLKVSIIPRGQGALGYALNVPGDNYLMNVHQMMDKMAMILGGRVSEELHFETVTSGASDDFNKVTRMATHMVTKYGMSEKIGYLFYEDDDNKLHKPFSEETSRNIDSEVKRIVSEAYQQCKQLLTEKKKEVGLIAEELLKKEVLDRDDMIRLLGKRPWEDNKEFEKYFGQKSAPPPPPTEPLMPPPPSDPRGPPPFPPPSETPGGAPVMSKDLR